MAWFIENFEVQRGYFPPSYDFKPLPELIELIKAAGGFAIVAHPHGCLDDIDDIKVLRTGEYCVSIDKALNDVDYWFDKDGNLTQKLRD